MPIKPAASVLVLAGLLTVSVPLFAHHGNASYENKTVMLKGAVTEWLWINPHVFLKIDVKDETGKVTNWVLELVPPSTMVNFGFTAKTFKAGDEVTVVTSNVARNGAPTARISQVTLANGKVMKTGSQYDGNALSGGGGAGTAPPANPR
jgi:hypothetical protein